VAGAEAVPATLRREIAAFRPDWVLVSSEDLGHTLLAEAHRSAPGRVVYLAHTPQFYPFGPASWNPDARATGLVTRSAAVVAIGRTTARYVEQYAGRPAAVIHPPIYGAGPWPDLARATGGLVAMINPSAVKGIAIFLDLARRFLHLPFGALEGWGTTAADRQEMAALPNISQIPPCEHIDEFLGRVGVLLMPSLWYEGFGLIVVQALLRGIPVVASDAGGLVEAKLGTRFTIPVRPIERYEPIYDEQGMPRPVIPPQHLAPWEDALAALGERTVYESESRASREAARAFVNGLRPQALEEMLASLIPSEPAASSPAGIEHLSPEKRALLWRRLHKPAS
jgi:hypothetical protein